MAKITFSGNGQAGNLSDPNNWVGGKVPGVDDFANILMSVGGPVGGTFEVQNMMLLGPEQITFTGTLDTFGNPLDCQGLMVCVGAGAVFAPGAKLNDTGVLVVGNGAAGTVLAEGSGTTHSVLTSDDAKLGALAAGVGTVTINDAIWNNTNIMVVGNLGEGNLNVTNGGLINESSDVGMAMYTGSRAEMTIASGSSVNVGGWFRDGVEGTASVSVASGASLTVDSSLVIGTGSTLALTGGTVSSGGGTSLLAGGVISGYGTIATTPLTTNHGKILATGGTLTVTGSMGGPGTVQIAANSTAVLTGSVLNLASIGFIGANASLSLAHGAWVAPIAGFALGDTISMANITAATFTAATGTLKLMDNNVQASSLHMVGTFAGDTFALHQSGSTGIISLQHS